LFGGGWREQPANEGFSLSLRSPGEFFDDASFEFDFFWTERSVFVEIFGNLPGSVARFVEFAFTRVDVSGFNLKSPDGASF